MKKLLYTISLFALISCGIAQDNKEGNRLVLANDSYYVYYEKEVIEIPKGTYITKENKIDDYFYNIVFIGKTVKNEKKLLLDLSKYFPHGITDVRIGEKPNSVVSLPVFKVDEKNMIDSIYLAEILVGQTAEALINLNNTSEIVEVKDANIIDPNVSLEGKTVEILNANGIQGFAANLGKAFETNLKMKYNAENYTQSSDISYIINHKLTEEEFNKFVNSLSLKYIKIKKDDNLKADADVVLITGNDAKVKNYPITIISNSDSSELKELLSSYNNVSVKKTDKEVKEIIIKHKAEDVVIARKLLSYIPEAKLEVDETQQGLTILSNR